MNSDVLNVLSPAIASQAHLLKGLSISRLPSNLLERLINDSAATGAEYRRVASINSVTQLAPNSTWCGVCVASSCCCIGTLVQDGTMGALRQDNTYLYLAPGYHTFCCFGRELNDPVRAPRVGTYSTFGPRDFANIGEGCIGVLVVGSQYKLLAPGLYEWDSPSVVCDGIVSLSADVVVLGPYRLISVSEGNVAVTFNNGALCILGGGDDTGRRTYFMDDVKWVFSCMLPTVIQTDRLEGNDLLSKDNVEILMVAMSHWRVVDPALAIVNCAPNIEGIRTKTNQLVRATIARIVAGTNIGNGPVSGSVAHPVVQAYAVGDPNAPAKPSANADETDLAHLMQSSQATQHMAQLSAQMSIMGIEVLGVFVPEKRIKNDDIRSQIARQAVIGIRAEAQRAAADATAYATLKGARAQAEAIEMLAAAHSEAGRRLGDPDSTASRLALSENLGKALTDANVTLFSGAPGMLPFMFGNSPAPAAGAKRRANGGSKGSANNTLGSIMDDQDVDLVAASRETDS